jgi:hypothetical protein
MSDYLVTVCSACKKASCWHGDFFCEESGSAGTVDIPASQLAKMLLEHPSCYSTKRLLEVCGTVRYVHYDDGQMKPGRRTIDACLHRGTKVINNFTVCGECGRKFTGVISLEKARSVAETRNETNERIRQEDAAAQASTRPMP